MMSTLGLRIAIMVSGGFVCGITIRADTAMIPFNIASMGGKVEWDMSGGGNIR